MTAVTIMLTAFRQIFANFGQVVRIVLLPCLIAAAVIVGGAWTTYEHRNIPGIAIFTMMLTAAICALWTTVNFHRHVLLGERFGWLPRLHLREMAGYGIMTIPMWLVLAGCTWALMLVLKEVTFATSWGDHGSPFAMPYMILVTLVSSTLLTGLALRLFSLLPGLAIGEALRGYARPLGSIPTILLIALILSGLRTGYSLLLWLMTTRLEPQTAMFVLNASWFTGLVIGIFAPIYAISLLTALYARYVGKPTA